VEGVGESTAEFVILGNKKKGGETWMKTGAQSGLRQTVFEHRGGRKKKSCSRSGWWVRGSKKVGKIVKNSIRTIAGPHIKATQNGRRWGNKASRRGKGKEGNGP